jgi:signal transduction histidine kinase
VQRRLVLVMVIVVAIALAIAGAGSLLIDRHYTGTADRNALRVQADEIAKIVDTQEANPTTSAGGLARGPLVKIRRDMTLIQGVTAPFISSAFFISVTPGGSIAIIAPAADDVPGAAAAHGITLDATDIQALDGNDTVSQISTTSTTAIAPLDIGPTLVSTLKLSPGTIVAIALVAPISLPGATGLYFAIAAGISLAIGVLVAIFFAGRITDPLSRAAAATGRIAAGDFDSRLPVSPTEYPELNRLAEAINSMAERLGQSRNRERQFLLSISHDLRTPLTSIRGYAEAISDGATDDPAKAAGVISSEANRLDRLIRDLLDLARLDAHRFAIDVRRVDLAEVASATAEGLRLSFEDDKLELGVETTPGILVAADPDRLSQVISNLVENAGRYARGRIRVATVPSPVDVGRALLLIEDDGQGIAPGDIPHVFERFYTAETDGRPLRGGSGLGLAIVSELVQAMGGTVRAESPIDAGGGTRLVVELRRWQGPAN